MVAQDHTSLCCLLSMTFTAWPKQVTSQSGIDSDRIFISQFGPHLLKIESIGNKH